METFHPFNSTDPLALSVMPTAYYERVVKGFMPAFTACSRVGFQWMTDYGTFTDDVVSLQWGVGAKIPITGKFTGSCELSGVLPVTDVPVGDPRSENGAVAFTMTITRTF